VRVKDSTAIHSLDGWMTTLRDVDRMPCYLSLLPDRDAAGNQATARRFDLAPDRRALPSHIDIVLPGTQLHRVVGMEPGPPRRVVCFVAARPFFRSDLITELFSSILFFGLCGHGALVAKERTALETSA
jgi:hypothetical protein